MLAWLKILVYTVAHKCTAKPNNHCKKKKKTRLNKKATAKKKPRLNKKATAKQKSYGKLKHPRQN